MATEDPKTTAKAENPAAAMSKTLRKGISFLTAGEERSHEDLVEIEKRRRAILKRSDLPFFKLLTFTDGTVLSNIIDDPLTWITLGVYAGIRFAAYYGLPTFISDIAESANVAVIGGF